MSMRNRLALLILSLFAGACSDTTAPVPHTPPAVEIHWTPKDAPSKDETVRPNPDGTCKSGYSVATGRNGETICVPDGETGIQAIPHALPDTL
jgi:hypothetical protein